MLTCSTPPAQTLLRTTAALFFFCALLAACPGVGPNSSTASGPGSSPGGGPLPRPAPVETSGPAPVEQKVVDAQKLLCERIWLQTSSAAPAPRKTLHLEHLSSEGGAAQIYIKGDLARITGEILGCSVRAHFDYRYKRGALICARDSRTSMETISGCDAKGQPEGECRPAFWESSFTVFSAGKLLYSRHDAAPRSESWGGGSSAEILELATDLLKRAGPQPTVPGPANKD